MTLPARCIKNELDDCKWGLHLTLLTILHRSLVSLEGRDPGVVQNLHVYVCMTRCVVSVHHMLRWMKREMVPETLGCECEIISDDLRRFHC